MALWSTPNIYHMITANLYQAMKQPAVVPTSSLTQIDYLASGMHAAW